MRIIRDVARAKGPSAVAIGNFDGLHAGHRQIITRLIEQAKMSGLVPTVLTFEPAPHTFLRPLLPQLRLMSWRQKMEGLARLGVKQVLCLRFNAKLAEVTATDFIAHYLKGRLRARHVCVGENFRFGQGKAGDVDLLRQEGGFVVDAMPLIPAVSSSLIRANLLRGDLAQANADLGRPYSLLQRVIRGAQRGRLLGFPTANLRVKKGAAVAGVFLNRVYVEGKTYVGVSNVGTRPTVDGKDHLAEIHLLGFNGDLYGKRIRVDFLHQLRDERKFPDIEALKKQIECDIKTAKAMTEQMVYE